MREHTKEILLVEDQPKTYRSIIRSLRAEGYHVTLAKTLDEALNHLDTARFHLAIVDLVLIDDYPENQQGMELLKAIEERQLEEIMPRIVLTGYPSINNILEATQDRGASFIEKEPGYRKRLLAKVEEIFEEKIKINFGLKYPEQADSLLDKLTDGIYWPKGSRPVGPMLTQQVMDLLGKLYRKADSLKIVSLRPGLTGAIVFRVFPTYPIGAGPTHVVKISRRKKIKVEEHNYNEYVKPLTLPQAVELEGTAYTQHLGALQYTFAEGNVRPYVEFDEYYSEMSSKEIVSCLKRLFQSSYKYWYGRRIDDHYHLPELYYQGLRLTQEKLIVRIQTILPSFDPESAYFKFERIPIKSPNPIFWLNTNYHQCYMIAYQSVTHGDLTGRNIMVRKRDGASWLIDFYRTYTSHILRDFVILETDIKYRLLPDPSEATFWTIENCLRHANDTEALASARSNLSNSAEKALDVILAIRDLAYKYTLTNVPSETSRGEYLISLLMATLNVVRLRHINDDRKLQAMLSAGMICSELDEIAGRRKSISDIDDYFEKKISDQKIPVAKQGVSSGSTDEIKLTSQQLFFYKRLRKRKLYLFTGSAVPANSNWPSLEGAANVLMDEIEYQPSPDDQPWKSFEIYSDEVAGRDHLIKQLFTYYNNQTPPPLFSQITSLDWRAIYTTNQHTYLENAYDDSSTEQVVLISSRQLRDTSVDSMTIIKLFGCLCEDHRRENGVLLPLTDSDHQKNKTKKRIRKLLEGLKLELEKGAHLLMLYPTRYEIELLSKYVLFDKNSASVWVASSEFSEQEQEVYQRRGLRFADDSPDDLLSILSMAYEYA